MDRSSLTLALALSIAALTSGCSVEGGSAPEPPPRRRAPIRAR
jgi:hypothetical protein